MAELSEGLSGYLDVENATLRAPRIEATSNIGIANTNPQHAFSVGSNLYIDTESSNVLTVKGNVVTEGIKMGFLEITPSYDLAAVSNVGNVTANTIIFTNETQGFVATGNATIGSTLTVSGFRITAAAAAQDDLEAITTDGRDPPTDLKSYSYHERHRFDYTIHGRPPNRYEYRCERWSRCRGERSRESGCLYPGPFGEWGDRV
jgi:hypothetical protein